MITRRSDCYPLRAELWSLRENPKLLITEAEGWKGHTGLGCAGRELDAPHTPIPFKADQIMNFLILSQYQFSSDRHSLVPSRPGNTGKGPISFLQTVALHLVVTSYFVTFRQPFSQSFLQRKVEL